MRCRGRTRFWRSAISSPYTVNGVTYEIMDDYRNYRERGIASWYGSKFHGHETSNGEIFDLYAASAAHKTLPLPTYARVTNLENGRSIVVRVNDRGTLPRRPADRPVLRRCGQARLHGARDRRRSRWRSSILPVSTTAAVPRAPTTASCSWEPTVPKTGARRMQGELQAFLQAPVAVRRPVRPAGARSTGCVLVR